MVLRLKILSIAALSIFLLVGCSKDEKVQPPTEPAISTGVTDNNGHATIDVGNFTANVDVRNAEQVALPNIDVETFLLHDNVVVIATDPAGTYLPTVAVSGWSGSGKRAVSDYSQSPVEIMGTDVQSTIILQTVQQGYYGYEPDPANFDAITTDEWTIETASFGPLSQLYQLLDTSSAYSQGICIRLASPVEQILFPEVRTASFRLTQETDFPTFATTLSLAFGMLDDDSIYYSQLEYTDQVIPVIHVDNIHMHRNLWAQFRLTWGQNPSDLDSHLWTPLFGTSYYDSALAHICYYRRGSSGQAPYADLDVDDVNSYGPERVTIYQNFPGTYVYAVHHYSGSGTFNSSGAKVNLLKPDGTVQIFDAPPDVAGVGYDWYWHVCQIDGQTGAVTPINTYSQNPPRGDFLAGIPEQLLLKASQ
jgi:hypothetical protein